MEKKLQKTIDSMADYWFFPDLGNFTRHHWKVEHITKGTSSGLFVKRRSSVASFLVGKNTSCWRSNEQIKFKNMVSFMERELWWIWLFICQQRLGKLKSPSKIMEKSICHNSTSDSIKNSKSLFGLFVVGL